MTDLFQTTELPSIDPNKDYTPEIMGEGKKYGDQAAVSRAVLEKDRFIEQLKREQAGLRKELSERVSMENMLTQIKEATKPPQVQPQPQPQPSNHEGQPGKEEPVNIEDTVLKLMNQKEQERVETANIETVKDRLRKAYGENYASRVNQEASRLGVGTVFLSDVARKSPQAFFELLRLSDEPKSGSVTPPVTSFRPTNGTDGQKTYSHYEAMRKSDPSKYWSPANQNEMMKQLEALGQEAFYK